MIELLGPMPKNYAMAGKNFENFFRRDPVTDKFVYKNISGLRHFPLKKLLIEKYRLKYEEAEELNSFLLPML